MSETYTATIQIAEEDLRTLELWMIGAALENGWDPDGIGMIDQAVLRAICESIKGEGETVRVVRGFKEQQEDDN